LLSLSEKCGEDNPIFIKDKTILLNISHYLNDKVK